MRTTYRNGQDITLRCGCDGCSPMMINGLLCHEQGCPDAWRDRRRDCNECGCDFFATERHAVVCEDCAASLESNIDPSPFLGLRGDDQ